VTTAPSASSRLATVLRSRRRSLPRSAAVGDAAAFAAVYERHHQALYRYCRSILQHDQDAQDALQSTMTRAFAALQAEQRTFELRPWLFRIAHNEAIALLRRRRPVEGLDELETRDPPVDEQVALRADLQHLHRDLAALPERQRAALVLRELNGLSHTEIAQVLACTPQSAKQSIYEARIGLMHAREGRELACETVRRRLSDGDGRVLRGVRMRAHLRSCSTCRRFQHELVQRPRELAMLAPPLPVAAGATLIAQLLPASGAATMAAFAPKVVATIAVIAAAAGGTAAVRHRAPAHTSPRPEARAVRATTPAASDDAAGRVAAPVTQNHDVPVKTAKRPAASHRSNRPKKRPHGSSRRATGAPKKARGPRAPTPRRPPTRAAKARGPKPAGPKSSAVPPKPRPAKAKGRPARPAGRGAGTRHSRGPRPR
jgi:RNA polymerase sigma factor (sigma-70 family)